MEPPVTDNPTRRDAFWVEFFFVCALILVLPSLEAPKNIFWIAYVATWLYNRFKTKQFGGAWDTWDTLIAVWIASGYIMAPFAGFHHSEWGGANDILRYGSILWLIKRSGYGPTELRWMLIAIIASTGLALWEGIWRLLAYQLHHETGGLTLSNLWEGIWQLFTNQHHEKELQLNSVGQVNHSAIYLAISYGVAASYALAYWNSTLFRKAAITMISVFLGAGILISNSRAAVGMTAILTIMLGIAWLKKSRKPLLILATLAAVIAVGAYVGQISVVKKQENVAQSNYVLAGRNLHWHVAIAAWEKYPIFGVGMHNFGKINVDDVQQWRKEAGKPFVASEYLGGAHAHSLYMNALAERGLFGITILLAVLLAWIYWLLKFRPERQSKNLEWALWGGAFSAWVITAGIGYANTTLHHEHAILSVTLLGMWLAYRKQINTPQNAGQKP